MNKNVLIVNFNTTLLTQCCIKSVNKFTPGCKIYVFDNSDKEPFVNIFENVEVIDNTKGQIINWDSWKKKYVGDKKTHGTHNNYASAKHCFTVEKCMELLEDNFVIIDSDALVKKDFSELYDDKFIYVAETNNQMGMKLIRVIPFICFINVKLCKEKNIHFFNEMYMHGLGHGSGDNWDTGAYFYEACKNEKHKEVRYSNYVVHLGNASWRNKNVSSWINQYKDLWQGENIKIKMDKEEQLNKKVVYTCISGKYDTLQEPEFISEGFDYVCFTDQPFVSKVWKIREIPKELDGLSQVKKQRMIKINAHKYLSDYDFSVWVDANVLLKGDINEYISKNCTEKDVSVWVGKHPQRDCIYKEGNVCIMLKKDTKENIDKQMDIYRKEGFPEHYGLPQTCIILRFHNDESCKKLMEAWAEQVKKYSHRDQLSFNYALWKNQDVNVKYLDKKIFSCETFKWQSKHKKPVFEVKKGEKKPDISNEKTTLINVEKNNTSDKKKTLKEKILEIRVKRIYGPNYFGEY